MRVKNAFGSRVPSRLFLSLAFLFALVAPMPLFAAAKQIDVGDAARAVLPIERQVREQFPSVALDSQAILDAAQEFVEGRIVSGTRTRRAPPRPPPALVPGMPLPLGGEEAGALRVFYPGSYDETFVAELGEQRVALRAIGARRAPAVVGGGKVFYSSPHDSVDVIEVPGTWRSEELLVLYTARAPRVFEYEIVEMRGVTGLTVHDGAIRFLGDHGAMPIAGGPFSAQQLSLQIDRPWVIDANGKRSETAAHWMVIGEQGQPRRIRLTVSSDRLAYPLVVDPSFSATGTLTAARYVATATLLPNGKVLIAGGSTSTGSLNTAELYDPFTGTTTATGIMTVARFGHTATLLPNGKVLIAGGRNPGQNPAYLNTGELYDPASGAFAAITATMTAARYFHTATLLSTGKVLIAGGYDGNALLTAAELYDPAAGTFTAAEGTMTAARISHTATLLPNGNVLIAGGSNTAYLNTAELYDPGAGTFTATTGTMTAARGYHTATLLPSGKVLIASGGNPAYLNTAEVYDPTAGTFTASGNLKSARIFHTATLLPNGKVLIAGGYNVVNGRLDTAELYDPAVGAFLATSGKMTAAREFHTATLLPNGQVLIAGGYNGAFLNTAEVYDAAAGAFTVTGTMTVGRYLHTATLMPNGKVLIAGGSNGTSALNTADLYDHASGTFTATNAIMTVARSSHTATLLPNGKVLIAGGYNGGVLLNTAEIYDPATSAFMATTGSMTNARYGHSATLLPNGKVLIAGGSNIGDVYLNTAELYDPAAGTFAATAWNMTVARSDHSATLLPNRKVLIGGGQTNGGGKLNTAELYDAAAGMFTAITGSMPVASLAHTATLLPNGKVLIAGGFNSTFLTTAALYDPATDTFTATTGTMTAPRYKNATLLPSGKVLIAGGSNGTLSLNTAELYDPATGTFTATTGTMTAARRVHTTTLLPNGKVLIVGGANSGPPLNTAELYDVGLGYTEGRRPVVSTSTNPLCQPGTLSLSGSLFTGDSEGSSGSTNSSPANAPLLRLQRVDNEQLLFASPQSFSAVAYSSETLNSLATGRYRAVILSNAIPSIEQIIEVATTPVLGTYGPASVDLSGSTIVTPSSLPAGYDGAYYPLTATASSGFTGTLKINAITGVVMVSNAGPAGTHTITVSSSTSCGSPATTFTLNVLGPPDSVTATGGTPQSSQVNTLFASQLQATVEESAGQPLENVTVTFTVPSSGASATLSGGGLAQTNTLGVASITATANGILGSYNVTAVIGALTATFALTNTPATPTNVVASAVTPTSVLVTWSGTAGATYELQRQAAGGALSILGSSTSGALTDNTATADSAYLYRVRAIAPAFTSYGAADLATTVIFADPTLTPGSTIVKAIHFHELRTAVNAVRMVALMSAFPFTDATLTPGSSTVKADHLTQLRTALDDARSWLLLPPISYANPTITAGTTVISTAHINDLRNGVK